MGSQRSERGFHYRLDFVVGSMYTAGDQISKPIWNTLWQILLAASGEVAAGLFEQTFSLRIMLTLQSGDQSGHADGWWIASDESDISSQVTLICLSLEEYGEFSRLGDDDGVGQRGIYRHHSLLVVSGRIGNGIG